jgi:GNAT superfamily N-acetyltransferase
LFSTVPAEYLLAEHDTQVRGTIEQRLPNGWVASRRGNVLLVRTRHRGLAFSDGLVDLAASEVDQTVSEAVAFFAEHGEAFEWKTYSHDNPALVRALEDRGLRAEPRESVMIGRLETSAQAMPHTTGVSIRRVTEQVDLASVAELESEVWHEDWSWLADDLADRLDSAPDDIAIWVAEHGDAVVSAAWLVRLPGTEFAGLWGGSTREAWRGKGIYRSLVAVRAELARAMGARYLWVDASDDSRPILERLGMRAVATTTPWVTRE